MHDPSHSTVILPGFDAMKPLRRRSNMQHYRLNQDTPPRGVFHTCEASSLLCLACLHLVTTMLRKATSHKPWVLEVARSCRKFHL